MGDINFPEYDPTPYGGGLDLEELYGKSIAPSEKSCYAPSEVPSSVAADEEEEQDDKLSVISAYGVELPDFETNKRNSPKGKQEEQDHASPMGKQEEQDHASPMGKQEEQNHAGPWTPIYPVPDHRLRDSDLVPPCCTCATPNYCTCPYNIFSFNNHQEEEEEEEEHLDIHHDPSSPTHVANKVAQWLFSSTYI